MSDLATLLGGHFALEWYEGVAIVREVADRLLSTPVDKLLIPELNQIRLTAEGHVDIVGGAHSNEPVRRLGQLLLALIASSDAPVQLRLVISQATAPSPVYASIGDYSEALAFFERPERSAVLRRLAERSAQASPPDLSDSSITLDKLAPLPTSASTAPERKAKPPSPPATNPRRVAAVAVVLLLIFGGTGWFVWNRRIGPQARTDVSAMANRASEVVGTAVMAGASAVTERLGLGRIVPAAEATAPAEPAPVPAPPVPQSKRQVVQPSTDPLPPLFAFDLDPPAGESGPPPAVPPLMQPRDLSIPEPRPEDRTIYSVGSPGVTPPQGLRPQLARELPENFDRDRLGRIELIIAADGSVEVARLMTPPRTVHDGLFLSVVKNWNFVPALKDGFPVRYRKTIWVASPSP